jgi:hypothetical protein
MAKPRSRILKFGLFAAALTCWATLAAAQSSDPKAGNQQRQQSGQPSDAVKDGQRKIDEFAEAARVLGGPASNPECVWLGRRVVSLLWRDDLDTAFRHLDVYDRFGCPGGHIQATFRCLVRQGSIDPKAQESLHGRVHACWIDPDLKAGGPASTTGPVGTTTR